MSAVHVVNVSGGKDSDCCYLLAVQRERPFRAVFADTGHEHEWTYEHVERLSERTGGPKVETVKMDFSAALERRRDRLPEQWGAAGIPEELIARALVLLQPTGIPYLDLVMSKGMFAAGARRKFCTEELKIRPTNEQVVEPLLTSGLSVIQWLGIRADESAGRADAAKHPKFQWVQWPRAKMGLYRPILAMTLAGVVEMHRHFGLPMNPLYAEGFTRVGCFPCINERKESLAIIARRFPAAVDKLRAWEALCTEVNVARRKGPTNDVCTFFPAGTVPRRHRNGIDEIMDWAVTSRGGRQYNLIAGYQRIPIRDAALYACTDGMGFCEA